ncbi:MAG: zinc-dependent metalloprotease [Actinomycetota bacterium]|nr:zinc-dependent metalloprotease [Actinomycetota bacterium]
MIAWTTAAKVAKGLIATFPSEDKAALERTEQELGAFSAQALSLVSAASGLHLDAETLPVSVVTRSEWVDANVHSMSALLDPLAEKLSGNMPGPLGVVGAQASAVQFGLLFGWMSRRVLGQYDAALFANGDGDYESSPTPIYIVGSNIISLEARFGFPREQFERWVLLHELTHKLQFEAVPWMVGYYRGLVSSLIENVNLGPGDLLDGLTRVVEELREGRNPLRDSGVAGLFINDQQRAILARLGGLMSVLEGHGDLIMGRAAAGVIPEAERFEEALHQRRESPNLVAKIIGQLYGLDAKLRQYAAGKAFLEAIEEAGGQQAIARLFEKSEFMPDLDEINDPHKWLGRVGVTV